MTSPKRAERRLPRLAKRPALMALLVLVAVPCFAAGADSLPRRASPSVNGGSSAPPALRSERDNSPGELSAIVGFGDTDERLAVIATLKEYLRVVDARDASAASRSFHPAAVLSSVNPSGEVSELSQRAWLDRIAGIPADAPARKCTVALVDVSGVSAVARIDIVGANGAASSDHFTLLKTRHGWRIMNKTLSVPL